MRKPNDHGLRTTGAYTGNWGKGAVKAGSSLRDLGVTSAEVINITTQDDYLKRMYDAWEATEDPRLKLFCFEEIKKILIQRGIWEKQS